MVRSSFRPHSPPVVDEGGGPGAPVIHSIERAGPRVQRGGKCFSGRPGESADDPNKGKQGADNHVAEDHVEQQLFIGPPRAVAFAVEFSRGCAREPGVEEVGSTAVPERDLVPCWLHGVLTAPQVRGPTRGPAPRIAARRGSRSGCPTNPRRLEYTRHVRAGAALDGKRSVPSMMKEGDPRNDTAVASASVVISVTVSVAGSMPSSSNALANSSRAERLWGQPGMVSSSMCMASL